MSFSYQTCTCEAMEFTHVHLNATDVIALAELERTVNAFMRNNPGVEVDSVMHGRAGFSISGHKVDE